ncbi:MAG: hypothetical protein EOP04_19825 [Proteobacteria bacterium]|nr:MAG: hypothetical protein EOP04_19825 [Pseudomonadota bacterium]
MARDVYKATLVDRRVTLEKAAKGETSHTTTRHGEGSFSGGYSAVAELIGGVTISGSTSITHTNGIIDRNEMDAIDKEAKRAFDNPAIIGKKPSILCYWDRKMCDDGSGKNTIKKDQYKRL